MFRAARQCRGFLHKYPTSGLAGCYDIWVVLEIRVLFSVLFIRVPYSTGDTSIELRPLGVARYA